MPDNLEPVEVDDLSPERERTSPPTAWRAGLTDEQFRELTTDLLNSGFVLDQLKTVIRAKYRATKPALSDYTNPSWAYQMADTNGYRRALEDILNLLP